MVADLIRDSPFGHIARLVTQKKCFQYPEEKDPNLWKKYVNQEKSGYVAHHGNTSPPEDEVDELREARGIRDREGSESSCTEVGEEFNHASGMRIDQEKGKDQYVIDWFGPDDPQVWQFSSVVLAKLTATRTPATGAGESDSLSHSKSVF